MQRDDNLICMQCKCNYYGKRWPVFADGSYDSPLVTPSRWIQFTPLRTPIPSCSGHSVATLHKCHYCCRCAWAAVKSWMRIRFRSQESGVGSRESGVGSLDRTLSQTDWQLNWKVWRHFSLFDLWLPLASWARYAKIAENISPHFHVSHVYFSLNNFFFTLFTAGRYMIYGS